LGCSCIEPCCLGALVAYIIGLNETSVMPSSTPTKYLLHRCCAVAVDGASAFTAGQKSKLTGADGEVELIVESGGCRLMVLVHSAGSWCGMDSCGQGHC
jgi:hypothetical protein